MPWLTPCPACAPFLSTQVLPLCGSLVCFDISQEMLRRAEQALRPVAGNAALEFVLLEKPELPARFEVDERLLNVAFIQLLAWTLNVAFIQLLAWTRR
jgi:hypothetical protein